jgi:hypothetical protein
VSVCGLVAVCVGVCMRAGCLSVAGMCMCVCGGGVGRGRRGRTDVVALQVMCVCVRVCVWCAVDSVSCLCVCVSCVTAGSPCCRRGTSAQPTWWLLRGLGGVW